MKQGRATWGVLARSVCRTRQRHSWTWKLGTNGKTSCHLSRDLDVLWGLVNLPSAGLSTIPSRALCWASRHLLALCFISRIIQMATFPERSHRHAQPCIQSRTACLSWVSVVVTALPWWEGFQTHFFCFPRESLTTSPCNYPQRRKCCFFFFSTVLPSFLLLSFGLTHLHLEYCHEVTADQHQLNRETREMPCSGRARLHTDFIHLSFGSDSSMVSLILRRLFSL